MELSNLLKLNRTPTTAKFLALEIGMDCVRTASWEMVEGQVSIIQVGSSEAVDINNPEELLQAIDTSLIQAQMGVEPEPNQMILSVPDSWLVESKIAKDKMQVLKYISDKLEIKIIGFVVTLDAVIQYLEKQKGQPINLIVLGLSAEEVAVSLIKNSQAVGTQVVGRSDDLGSDVKEGLARFEDVKALPAHMVLYDGNSDLEQYQQDLIDYDWQAELPFLHIPKIDRLTGDEIIKAVVMIAGPSSIATQTDSVEPDEEPSSEVEPLVPDLQQEFGFEDTTIVGSGDELESQTTAADDNVEAVDLMPEPEEIDEQEVIAPTESATTQSKPWWSRLLSSRQSSTRIPRQFAPIKLLIGLVIALVLILIAMGAGLAAMHYLPSASATVYLEPTLETRQLRYTVVADGASEPESGVVAGTNFSTDITANTQTLASGEKLVGDRAKGTVTLFNRTDTVKNFAAGTRLTGPAGKIYTLDVQVTMASASATEKPDLSVTIEPAKVDVAVTALDIGADYNLDSGTELAVANFDKSSYIARATTGISGGTSRQITAVSQTDVDNMRRQVTAQIEQKIAAAVNQAQPGANAAVLLSDGSDTKKETLSAKVGEEANIVTLDVSTKVRSLTYSKAAVIEVLRAQGDPVISQIQLPRPEDIEITTLNTRELGEDKVEVEAKIQIKVLPILDISEIKKNLAGKNPKITEEHFVKLTGFKRVEIDARPKWLGRFLQLPRDPDRFSIEIVEYESDNDQKGS